MRVPLHIIHCVENASLHSTFHVYREKHNQQKTPHFFNKKYSMPYDWLCMFLDTEPAELEESYVWMSKVWHVRTLKVEFNIWWFWKGWNRMCLGALFKIQRIFLLWAATCGIFQREDFFIYIYIGLFLLTNEKLCCL